MSNQPLIVGNPALANVYLMCAKGLIRAPSALNNNDTLIADLCARHKLDMDLKLHVHSVLSYTIPTFAPQIVNISSNISEHISSQSDFTIVDLTSYDIDVQKLHELLQSISTYEVKKLTAEEYWPMRDLLIDHIKYVQPFKLDLTIVNAWKAAVQTNSKGIALIYADLFANRCHKFTDAEILDTLITVGHHEVFQSDHWSIPEDKVVEIMKKYVDQPSIDPDLRQKIISYIRLELLINKILCDPILKTHPNIYEALCELAEDCKQLESGIRNMHEDFLIVRHNTGELLYINGNKYIPIRTAYPNVKQCVKIIKNYIETYESFDFTYQMGNLIGTDPYYCIRDLSGDYIWFVNHNSKMSIDFQKYSNVDCFQEYRGNSSLCIYVKNN